MEIKTYKKITLTNQEMTTLERALDMLENIEYLSRLEYSKDFANYTEKVLFDLDDYIDKLKERCVVE